jgi:uncharacterized membrane protein
MRARTALTTLALVALAGVVAADFCIRAWLATPDYGRAPRLAAVIDGGKMEEFIEAPSEKETILSWVARGAPKHDWPDVERVLEARCTTCHHSEASYEMLPLDNYEDARLAARVLPVLREKITGGTMGEYLETVESQTALIEWIDAGAPESDWPRAKDELDAHCAHCHNPEGVQGIVTLQTYSSVSRLATLPRAAPRAIAAPAVVLLASLVGLGGLGIYAHRNGTSRS